MKKRSEAKGEKTSGLNQELPDEADKFINKKKIQNKILKEIIDQLQNATDIETQKPNN